MVDLVDEFNLSDGSDDSIDIVESYTPLSSPRQSEQPCVKDKPNPPPVPSIPSLVVLNSSPIPIREISLHDSSFDCGEDQCGTVCEENKYATIADKLGLAHNSVLLSKLSLLITLYCDNCSTFFIAPYRLVNKNFQPRFFCTSKCSCNETLKIAFYIPLCATGGYFTRSFSAFKASFVKSTKIPSNFKLSAEMYAALTTSIKALNLDKSCIKCWTDDSVKSSKGKPLLIVKGSFSEMMKLPNVKEMSLFNSMLKEVDACISFMELQLEETNPAFLNFAKLYSFSSRETSSKTLKSASAMTTKTVANILDGNDKKRAADSELAKKSKRMAIEKCSMIREPTPVDVEERQLDRKIREFKQVSETKRKVVSTLNELLESYRSNRQKLAKLIEQEQGLFKEITAMNSPFDLDNFPDM